MKRTVTFKANQHDQLGAVDFPAVLPSHATLTLRVSLIKKNIKSRRSRREIRCTNYFWWITICILHLGLKTFGLQKHVLLKTDPSSHTRAPLELWNWRQHKHNVEARKEYTPKKVLWFIHHNCNFCVRFPNCAFLSLCKKSSRKIHCVISIILPHKL